jgi:hypothetical protein
MIPSENAITSGNYEEVMDEEEGINKPKKVTIPIKEISDDQEEAAELSRECDELRAEISKLTSLNERLMAEKEQEQKEHAIGEYSEFVEDCIATGRILPRDKAVIVENFKVRAELDSHDVKDFAEGKIKTPSINRVQQYKDYLESMPQSLCFEELLVGKPEVQQPSNFVEEEIAKVRSAVPSMKYEEAMAAVRAMSPENASKVDSYLMDSFKQ